MANIPYVDDADPLAAAALEFARGKRDSVGFLHRQMAHVPALVEGFEVYSAMVRKKLPIEFELFGLIVLRTVQAIRDQYEWTRCVSIARKGGIEDARIIELWDWRGSSRFSARQKAALAIVDEHCIEKPVRPSAASAAREHLSDPEIVAVCAVMGWFLLTAAFTTPLHLVEDDPVAPPELVAMDARTHAS